MSNVYTVEVRYPDAPGRLYDFLTDIEGIAPGNKLVVEASTGLGIVTVNRVKPRTSKSTAWVVCKIDMVAHQARTNRKKLLEDVKRRMRNYVTGDNSFYVYRALAQTDLNMAKMLDEYIDLGGMRDDIR